MSDKPLKWYVRGVPDDLRKKVKADAAMMGISIGEWMIQAINAKISKKR